MWDVFVVPQQTRARWNPGYFHPCLVDDASLKMHLRSLSDQTPSPSCIDALVEESKFLVVGGWESSPAAATTTNITSCSSSCSYSSSLQLSPPSPKSCVSDSSTSSSEASVSGDKLKKRRNYRKKRSLKRSCSFRVNSNNKIPVENKNAIEGSSPSAAYCEEWIYTTLSKSLPDNRELTSPCPFECDLKTAYDEVKSWRHTLEGDATTSVLKKTPSWLNIWQNWLKVAPKLETKCIEMPHSSMVGESNKLSPLPSISESEGGQSETICSPIASSSSTSSPSSLRKKYTLALSSSSINNIIECLVDTHCKPTNCEVCSY